jgi:hypothetical protein
MFEIKTAAIRIIKGINPNDISIALPKNKKYIEIYRNISKYIENGHFSKILILMGLFYFSKCILSCSPMRGGPAKV